MLGWWTRGGRETRVLEAIFRVGVSGCFIGHGAFGILGKEAWLPYFAVAGIPESWAWVLMPVVGSVDIAVGVVGLVSPRPAVLAHMVGWAFWTALLRPLAGESAFETLERAGNYGVPLAFLLAAGFRARGARPRDWLRPTRIGPMTADARRRVAWTLRGTVALLMVGHGGLALAGKPLLADHMAVVGVPSAYLGAMGWGEIVLGLAVAARPFPVLLVAAFVWKVGTEALFPITGAPFWEFVERAGSYAAPLALLALAPSVARRLSVTRTAPGVAIAAVVVGLLGLAGVAPAAIGAQGRDHDTASALLEPLRRGVLVLACRHAITDRSRGDARRVDYDDPATQRLLSPEGRAQARAMGAALRRLGVPIGEVLTSPFERTRESAELAFGRARRTDALLYGNAPAQVRERERLLTASPDGGNRVLMTHQGVLYAALPNMERGSIREGDCVVVEPRGTEGSRVLGRLEPEQLRALTTDRASGLHTSRTIATSSGGHGLAMMGGGSSSGRRGT